MRVQIRFVSQGGPDAEKAERERLRETQNQRAKAQHKLFEDMLAAAAASNSNKQERQTEDDDDGEKKKSLDPAALAAARAGIPSAYGHDAETGDRRGAEEDKENVPDLEDVYAAGEREQRIAKAIAGHMHAQTSRPEPGMGAACAAPTANSSSSSSSSSSFASASAPDHVASASDKVRLVVLSLLLSISDSALARVPKFTPVHRISNPDDTITGTACRVFCNGAFRGRSRRGGGAESSHASRLRRHKKKK